ncbi:aspartate/glutamate racemase family protein [Mesorhizobium sp. SB112]|uniref:aspartate/glutamate racemase family protein n=1 Tax=Mesorhizobium sp. SB112 TaxID=3151853 RepID=UPI0032676542
MTVTINKPKRVLYQLLSPLHRLVACEELQRRKTLLQAWAGPGVEMSMASPKNGPHSISCEADVAEAFVAVRTEASSWRSEGYDAVVLGCFSDPAITALREISGIPVIGPGAASISFACQLVERFSVLSSDPSPGGLRGRIRSMGFSDFFASERRVLATVADLRRGDPAITEMIVDAARGCVADGAQALVLGCLAMSFTPGLPERLQQEASVPVINPVLAALKTAEIAAAMRSTVPMPAE